MLRVTSLTWAALKDPGSSLSTCSHLEELPIRDRQSDVRCTYAPLPGALCATSHTRAPLQLTRRASTDLLPFVRHTQQVRSDSFAILTPSLNSMHTYERACSTAAAAPLRRNDSVAERICSISLSSIPLIALSVSSSASTTP